MPDYFTLLRDHVTLKCRSIDRIFLQAYVPKLQSVCLPKPTAEFWPQALLFWIPSCRNHSSNAALWPRPGNGWTKPSTPSQTASFSRLEFDHFVNFSGSK